MQATKRPGKAKAEKRPGKVKAEKRPAKAKAEKRPGKVKAEKRPAKVNGMARSRKAVSPAVVQEPEALQRLTTPFKRKRFTEAAELLEKVESSDGRLEALVTLCDSAFVWSIDLSAPAAHGLILSASAALGGRKLSVVAALPFAKERLSFARVCGAYAGSLLAAAWANDRRKFDGIAELVDRKPKEVRYYVHRCVDALSEKRPEFAANLDKLIDPPTIEELRQRARREEEKRPKRALQLYEHILALPGAPSDVVAVGLELIRRTYGSRIPKDLAVRWIEIGTAAKTRWDAYQLAALFMRLGRREEAVKYAVIALERGMGEPAIRYTDDLKPLLKHPALLAAFEARKG